MAKRVAKKWIKGPSDELAVKDGCWFDIKAADRVREFFRRFLKHSKGRWAGKPFEPLRWQWEDVLAPLFGWIRPDGTRRFRRAYIEIPKKNGKSTLCSGLSLYLLIGDGEQGAEVYSAAADRDQAGIVFNEAMRMAEASDPLAGHLLITASRKNIAFPRTNSFYRALSADVPTKEGLNISGLIFDELHAQKTRRLWDTLTYGGASRRQPLLIAITTAGYDRESICWEQHHYAEQVLDGRIADWSFFAYIRAAGPEDDIASPAVWRKANPSYGDIIQPEEMTEAAAEAKASPTKENTFKRYRLNIWTEQDVRWIPMAAWDACTGAIPPLAGRRCFAGLDLSSTRDLTALALLFPLDESGELFAVLPEFWVPSDNAQRREDADGVPYITWAREGLLHLTDGNVVDYEQIRKRLGELAAVYQIQEVAVDRWNATHLMTLLGQDGHEVVPFGQGFASMSAPSKKLEALILSGGLLHGGNPVLRWMAGNATVETDAAENLKPSKKKSTERIDGIVATTMALGRAIEAAKPDESIYKSRGLVTIG